MTAPTLPEAALVRLTPQRVRELMDRWVAARSLFPGTETGADGHNRDFLAALDHFDRATPAAPVVQPGWMVVPVEPTADMLRASLIPYAEAERYYVRMLAAAPQPQAPVVRALTDAQCKAIANALAFRFLLNINDESAARVHQTIREAAIEAAGIPQASTDSGTAGDTTQGDSREQ